VIQDLDTTSLRAYLLREGWTRTSGTSVAETWVPPDAGDEAAVHLPVNATTPDEYAELLDSATAQLLGRSGLSESDFLDSVQQADPWRDAPADFLSVGSPAELLASGRALLMGTGLFALLSEWRCWVERRVEQVEFITLNTVRRAVSVDLMIPFAVSPIRRHPSAQSDSYVIPLALYQKRRLNAFSLRDNKSGAVPLLSRRHNVPLATGALVAACYAWTGTPDTEALPPTIIEDLWAIASLPAHEALGAWRAFGRTLDSPNGAEQRWRDRLVRSPEFMALSYDLARNFVLAAIVDATPGEHRLLKFSYQEPSNLPFTTRREPIQLRGSDASATEPLPARNEDQRPRGVLCISARIEPGERVATEAPAEAEHGDSESSEVPGSAASEPDASSASPAPALAGISFVVSGSQGRFVDATTSDGNCAIQVPVGEYRVVEESLPARVRPVSPSQEVRIERGQTVNLTFLYRDTGYHEKEDYLPSLKTWPRITRMFAWAYKPIVLDAPGIGHAQSYHLEFEVPPGVQITRAELVDGLAYARSDTAGDSSKADAVSQSTQRAHVYTSHVAQERSGLGVFYLRPAVMTAALSLTLILLCIALSAASAWSAGQDGSKAPSALATIFLLVPGGISAYLSAGSEHPFTQRLLFGLRMLALSTGFWSFVAALTFVLSDLTSEHGYAGALDPLGPGFVALCCAALGQAATFGILMMALWRALRPPERLGVGNVARR
jgi:hypothetical protein